MCNISQGIFEKGLEKGEEKGADLLGKLISKLLASGRLDDIKAASENPTERKRLLKEFQLA